MLFLPAIVHGISTKQHKLAMGSAGHQGWHFQTRLDRTHVRYCDCSYRRGCRGGDLVQGGGGAALGAHGVPEGLQHLKGHVQQVLVEEVHHVLAQAVAPLQRLAGPPAGRQGLGAHSMHATRLPVISCWHDLICLSTVDYFQMRFN